MCMQIGKNTEYWFTDFMKCMCGKYCACYKKNLKDNQPKKPKLYKNVIISGVFFSCKPCHFSL